MGAPGLREAAACFHARQAGGSENLPDRLRPRPGWGPSCAISRPSEFPLSPNGSWAAACSITRSYRIIRARIETRCYGECSQRKSIFAPPHYHRPARQSAGLASETASLCQEMMPDPYSCYSHRFARRPRSRRRAASGKTLKVIFASQVHDRTRTVATGRRTSPSLCSKSS
jgi:hypothetical protein